MRILYNKLNHTIICMFDSFRRIKYMVGLGNVQVIIAVKMEKKIVRVEMALI